MNLDKIKERIFQKDLYKKVWIILLGVYILALNYNLFLLPNNFVVGGVSGLSIVTKELFGWSPTVFLYVVNIILLFLSFLLLDSDYTRAAIIGSFFYPLMISFTEPVAEFFREFVSFDNILITIIVTSILHGIANGLIYKVGFNTGGGDIMMKIVSKYFHLPEGKSSMIINSIIIVIGGYVLGIKGVIYSILILFLYTRIVDSLLIGVSDSKLFFIYTKEHKKVMDFIINSMHTGVTILETEGGFLRKKGNMLMCVVPTRDYYSFKETVLEIDPSSFFVIHDCYEVQGGKRRNLPFI